MYERFTDRARKVMELTQLEARRLGHENCGTEHILLGLIREGSGVGAHVLKNLGIDLDEARREVEKIVGAAHRDSSERRLPETPRAKQAIEYAMQEARNLHHNYVGTEHLLLGLAREREGVASQILANLGLHLDDVRKEVLDLLGHGIEEPSSPEKRSCCFCGQAIEPTAVDPCRLTIDTSAHHQQVWFFHAECFRSGGAAYSTLRPTGF